MTEDNWEERLSLIEEGMLELEEKLTMLTAVVNANADIQKALVQRVMGDWSTSLPCPFKGKEDDV